MKLSASTLGCFKWDLTTTLARLREYGYDGIDLRGLRAQLKLWELPEFSTGLRDSASRIRDSGLTVSCISSGIRLTDSKFEAVAAFDEELIRTAEICRAIDCRQIRVFGGDIKAADGATEADRPRLISQVAERAAALATRAAAIAPVSVLVETHDSWTSSEHMAAVLKEANRDNVLCCWDVKHTYWVARETPETTWQRLRPWIRNTHWKDARRSARTTTDARTAAKVESAGLLCPTGKGVCPLADCHALMKADGYDGWFTLEWEKHWHPHIEEPEVAFPEFVRFMRAMDA